MCREVVENLITKIFEEQGIKDKLDFNQKLENFGFNSRCFIKLVVQLEEFYDITISDEDLDVRRFETIQDICEMLKQYKNFD